MSYYQPQATKNRTAVWIGLAVVLVALLAVGAYFLGRKDSGSASVADPASSTGPAISWSIVGGQPVPASPLAGPRNTEGGRATGFSHDALGAALAAVNIGARLSSETGPAVYDTTARNQCFGDVNATLEQIRNSFSPAPAGSATPSEVWYRVVGGDPAADLVLISLAAKTPQSVASGGYVGFDRTLRWVDGDWRMQIPPSRPSIIPSVNGYTLLGQPHV
jgi:hypothetical protein